MLAATPILVGLTVISLGWTEPAPERQNAGAMKVQERVVSAFCDQIGAHVVYDSDRRLVQAAQAGETCSDMRVSEDKGTVGWLMTSEATAEDGRGNVNQRWQHKRLFVNGIEIKHSDSALYQWKFHDGGRQVVFEAGPLYGGGNMFLYDIAQKQVIDQCFTRRPGTVCPDWAK